MSEVAPARSALSMQRLDLPGFEDVRVCQDAESGLRAIVAVHDTTLGPALGGTRFYPYPDDDAALHDVRRLSEGMTAKAATAGLGLGGGKAVIIGDPARLRSVGLLHSYGRFVDSFDGRYITAADVGTTSADLDLIGEVTRHVVGRTPAAGGLGDSGHSTALGVFVSMRAAVERRLGTSLDTLTVGVEGIGKVGFELIGLLREAGARVIASDPYPSARTRALESYDDLVVVEDVLAADLDVYAPCALGATLTAAVVEGISARVVCGAANNQLASDDVEHRLVQHRVTWVPDFVANAGGLIQVAAERDGSTMDAARRRIHDLSDSVAAILERAEEEGMTAGEAARRLVADRLATARASRG